MCINGRYGTRYVFPMLTTSYNTHWGIFQYQISTFLCLVDSYVYIVTLTLTTLLLCMSRYFWITGSFLNKIKPSSLPMELLYNVRVSKLSIHLNSIRFSVLFSKHPFPPATFIFLLDKQNWCLKPIPTFPFSVRYNCSKET